MKSGPRLEATCGGRSLWYAGGRAWACGAVMARLLSAPWLPVACGGRSLWYAGGRAWACGAVMTRLLSAPAWLPLACGGRSLCGTDVMRLLSAAV